MGSMVSKQCKTCSLPHGYLQEVNKRLERGDSSSNIHHFLFGEGFIISERSVRRHREHIRKYSNTPKESGAPETLLGVVPPPDNPRLNASKMELGPEGGSFDNIQTTEPIDDWEDVFARFKLDSKLYEIVDDTVRMSVWNSGKIDEETGQLVDLYSYRAKFRKKTFAESNIYVSNLIESIRDYDPFTSTKQTRGSGPGVTAVIGLADWQLGKGEGDGTIGTVARIMSSLSSTVTWLQLCQKQGYNIERILLANLGDHTEATHGSYSNQPSTVDMNLRDQINTAIELNMRWITGMRKFAPVHYSACLCNHGQLSRVGHDPVMGDADNATGLIGDQLTHICSYVDGLKDVTFNIPQDEMITTDTVSGVNIAMAHGHKITGKEETWLATQSQALTHRENFIPHLWFTAHRHHASVVDLGPYTRIQATTEDPGSKWLLDQKGIYSTPGTTVFLTGESIPMKWTNYAVLS